MPRTTGTVEETLTRRVASQLRDLGLDVRARVTVRGSTATHHVEVLATLGRQDRTFAWVVGCHEGADVVLKDEVLALHRIAGDIGANGAVLVTQSHRHPNAVRAAEQTRTIMTTCDELASILGAELAQLRVQRHLEVIDSLCLRVERLWPWVASQSFVPGIPHDELLVPTLRVMELKHVVALRLATADYPVTVTVGDEVVEARSLDEAEAALDRTCAQVATALGALEARAVAAERAAVAAVETLTARSHEVFALAYGDHPEPSEQARASFADAVADFERELAEADRLVPEGTPSRTLTLARFLITKVAAGDDSVDRDYFMISLLFEKALGALLDSEVGPGH